MEYRDDLLIGLWKFDDNRVTEEDLKTLITEFQEDKDYLVLFLRKASKDQTGLGFVRKFVGGKKAQDEYHDYTSDLLKKRYGNGFVGWDYANAPFIAKWTDLKIS